MRKNDVERVADALRRGWLGGAGLRREDAQKADELAALLEEVSRLAARVSGQPFLLVDACAGKGALGLLASLLVLKDRVHRVVAIERDAVHQPRFAAAALTLAVPAAETTFTHGDGGHSANYPPAAHLVVALHACGGASDGVIDAVLASEARALLLVPCCYGAGPRHSGAGLSVRAQPLADAWRAKLPVPGHALLGKRMAQSLIDAERTLRLEAGGYETEVVEAWAPTLSPYHLLWRARRVREPVRMERARRQLQLLQDLVIDDTRE